MTRDELDAKITAKVLEAAESSGPGGVNQTAKQIRAALVDTCWEAIQKERERCTKIAEGCPCGGTDNHGSCCVDIARAIRG